MANWIETTEPYVKVVERVRTAATTPTAGEDLIIGAVFISDAGPSVPTLITSQSEFLSTYSSKDLSEDYLKTLDSLYTGDNKSLASTMWANAYRLAGSNTLLICRASKASDIYFAKPLFNSELDTYIVRDGELLKKVPSFKIVIDEDKDDAAHDQDGWSICINGVGIFGNRTTDAGPQYDYFVNSLQELVEQLNETPKFFSPAFEFYSDEKGTVIATEDNALSVVFDEVYLGVDILDLTDSRCDTGLRFLITCEPDWTKDNPDQKLIDLNSTAFSGFEPAENYATNVFNSSSELKVRIRRFNHDAVVSKEITDPTLNPNSDSPWKVLTNILDTYTSYGSVVPAESILERDFYEVCVMDPSLSNEPLFFNLGNITGRGDITTAELNEQLAMIQLQLPDNLVDLGLNYYGYGEDNYWKLLDPTPSPLPSVAGEVASFDELRKLTSAVIGDVYKVNTTPVTYYEYSVAEENQSYVDLTIDPTDYKILSISDSDLKKAVDLISQDEVYVTEGLSDLGNTELSFQNYLANLANAGNYFYPISTVYSSNYLTIANSASKISQESYKLYLSAPWDIDTGTLGWKVNMSPSVLYWESVARNKRNSSEFAPLFGQTNGVMQYQKPAVEFNKKTRQLLLSRKINSVLWNNQTSAWNMNDNFTKQTVDTIMSDEGNSRLAIRISKAMPVLLKQFIGWRISPRLWEAAIDVVNYWFKFTVIPMNYSIDDYRVQIDIDNNPEELQLQNKMQVNIYVRYQRSLKYVLVYHDILDVGMDLA